MRNRRRGGRMRYAPTLVRLWVDAVGLISDDGLLVLLFEISRITVGAYRIRPSCSRMRCISPVHIANGCWLNGYSSPWRAYAIRPYTCSVVNRCERYNFRCVFVGWVVWILANKVLFAAEYCLSLLMECVIAAMEGVCDTPLHLFGCELMR